MGEYVTLPGKKDFADVIKLRILRWGDNPELFGWAQYNHKGLYKRETGVSELEKEM